MKGKPEHSQYGWRSIALVMMLVCASVLSTAYALGSEDSGNSIPVVIESGSGVETASYIIYKDGDYTCAKNGTTGRIIFRNADAATVMNDVIDIVHGTGQTILVRYEEYAITSPINVQRGVSFCGESAIFTCAFTNPSGHNLNNWHYGPLDNNSVIAIMGDNIIVSGFVVDLTDVPATDGIVSWADPTTGNISDLNENVLINDCTVYGGTFTTLNVNGRGINMVNTIRSTVSNCVVSDNFIGISGYWDWFYNDTMTDLKIVDNNAIDNSGIGIYTVNYGGVEIVGNTVTGSQHDWPGFGSAGIWVGESLGNDKYAIVHENVVTNCTTGINTAGAGRYYIVSDNMITDNRLVGIYPGSHGTVQNNVIMNNGQNTSGDPTLRTGVFFGNVYRINVVVSTNIIGDNQSSATQLNGIYDSRACLSSRYFTGNIFISPAGVVSVNLTDGGLGAPNPIIADNVGVVTNEKGSVIAASGTSSKNIFFNTYWAPTNILLSCDQNRTVYVASISSSYITVAWGPAISGDMTIYYEFSVYGG